MELPEGLPFEPRDIDGYPLTDFGWSVVPEGFAEILQTFANRYGDRLPPIYITENGCSISEAPNDTRRIEYLDGHLRALHGSGVDVRGYFHWSLMDNFEWAAGYGQRFGLVHVDYETQRRTPKDSFAWYRDLIAANAT